MAEGINAILEERGKRYGEFRHHAEITQRLKSILIEGASLSTEAQARVRTRVASMQPDQVECLDMLAHKLGRILNGDPNYEDSWRDIAGYATLVADRLLKPTRS